MSEAPRAFFWYTNQGWAKYRIAKDVLRSSESVVVAQGTGQRTLRATRWYGTMWLVSCACLCKPGGFMRGADVPPQCPLLGARNPTCFQRMAWCWALLLECVALCTKPTRLWMVSKKKANTHD